MSEQQPAPVKRMSKWEPDDAPHQARRIGKTLEELGELTAVLARISIQGLDAVDPSSGKINRQRLEEEIADVMAQCEVTTRVLKLDILGIAWRTAEKSAQMAEWEEHYRTP